MEAESGALVWALKYLRIFSENARLRKNIFATLVRAFSGTFLQNLDPEKVARIGIY